MLDRALILEYWRDADGRYVAEARHHAIAATGESLDHLKQNIAERIRESFRGGMIPSVYDFVPRAGDSTAAADGSRATIAARNS
jgi:hypothetical protein